MLRQRIFDQLFDFLLTFLYFNLINYITILIVVPLIVGANSELATIF